MKLTIAAVKSLIENQMDLIVRLQKRINDPLTSDWDMIPYQLQSAIQGLDSLLDVNEKLQQRYSDGYTANASINRVN